MREVEEGAASPNLSSLKRLRMKTAKVSAKGQIILPKEIRDALGVRPGDVVGFEEKNGVITIRKVAPHSPFDKWVGRLRHRQGKRTDAAIEEMRGRSN